MQKQEITRKKECTKYYIFLDSKTKNKFPSPQKSQATIMIQLNWFELIRMSFLYITWRVDDHKNKLHTPIDVVNPNRDDLMSFLNATFFTLICQNNIYLCRNYTAKLMLKCSSSTYLGVKMLRVFDWVIELMNSRFTDRQCEFSALFSLPQVLQFKHVNKKKYKCAN